MVKKERVSELLLQEDDIQKCQARNFHRWVEKEKESNDIILGHSG